MNHQTFYLTNKISGSFDTVVLVAMSNEKIKVKEYIIAICFNINLQIQNGLSESQKPYLNLWRERPVKPRRNLVRCLIPLLLKQYCWR